MIIKHLKTLYMYTSFILTTVSETLSLIISFNSCPFLFNWKPSSKPLNIPFVSSSNTDKHFDKDDGTLCLFNRLASLCTLGVLALLDFRLGVLFPIPSGVPSVAMFPFWTVFSGLLLGVGVKSYKNDEFNAVLIQY